MASAGESCSRCDCAPVRAGVDRAFKEIARIAGQDDRTFNRDRVHRTMEDDIVAVRPGEGGVNFRPFVKPEGGMPYALSRGAGRPTDTRENLRLQMQEGVDLVDDIRRERPAAMPGLLPVSRRMGNGRQAANDAFKDMTRTSLPSELVIEQRFGRRAPREPRLWERERDVMTQGIIAPYGVVPKVDLRHATGQSVPRGQQLRPAVDNFEAVDPGALYHRTAAVSRQAAYGAAGKYDLQQSLRDAYSFPDRHNLKSNTFCGPCGRSDPPNLALPDTARQLGRASDEGFFTPSPCVPCGDVDEGMTAERSDERRLTDMLCGATGAVVFAVIMSLSA